MSNTHSAHIAGENFSAFIDGIPDKCEHDSDGESLYFNDAGKFFKTSEMPDSNTNPDEWGKFIQDNKINGGCCSCSKCGKPAFNLYDLY